MAMLTMALIAEALKKFYLKGLRYQLNESSSDFLAELERDSTSVQGMDIVLAMQYGRHGGVGNRADDADLPTPNSRKMKQVTYGTKNVFARIQITDKAIEASKGDAGAFAPMLETNLNAAEADAKEMLAREAFGDGTGNLATITAVAGNVLTVGTDYIHLFAEGMLVDTFTQAGAAHGAGMEITAVDDAAGTITVSAAGTTAVNDYIYLAGNKDQELTGMKALSDNATIYGLDRNTYKFLNIQKINVNGEINDIIIQKAIHDAKRKTGAVINALLCSFGVLRGYMAQVQAIRQIVNTTELKGGAKTVAFDSAGKILPIIPDNYCAKGEMWAISKEDLKIYELADWDWMDRDGSILHRVANKAAWEASLRKYCDLGCSRPKGIVKLYNIVEH